MDPAPIVLFVFNRPLLTHIVVEALQRNRLARESRLIIYSDAHKRPEDADRVREVRRYLRTITGFKEVTVRERQENYGLAANTIDALTTVARDCGRFIMLEDDNFTSPYFLEFVNEALICYENDDRVISAHGYLLPVVGTCPETCFIRGADTWGWATWKRGWDLFESDGRKLLQTLRSSGQEREFNFNGAYNYVKMLGHQITGKNNSWAIRWYASAFLNDKLTLYPGRSLVRNIGFGPGGTHCCRKTDAWDVPLSETPIRVARIPIEENKEMRQRIGGFLRTLNRRLLLSYIKGAFTRFGKTPARGW